MNWTPTITLKAALAGFEAIGLNRAALVNAMQIDDARLTDPYAAVPDTAFSALWQQAYEQDASLTLASRAGFAVPYGEFGLLDHLVNTATTLGEGLHMLNLFLWLVASGVTLEFSHRKTGDWVWVIDTPPTPGDYISSQWTLALIASRMRTRVRGFKLSEVHLTQPRSTLADEPTFTNLWGTPVKLGREKTGFRLADGAWLLKNEKATPELKSTLQTLAERVDIKQFNDAPLSYAVKARLPEALQAQAFAAEDIAEALNLSKRTLQRKLAHENISFKALLDSYRQEKATLLLSQTPNSIASVAYALGYEEQSSFNRAFKRWTGVSPSRWLEQGA